MQTPILTSTASHPTQSLSVQTPKLPRPLSYSSVSSLGSNASLSLLPEGDVEEVTEEGLRHAELKLEARCVLAFSMSIHAVASGQAKVNWEAQISCTSFCRMGY